MKEERDRLFRSALPEIPPFAFDTEVAEVFDDMANRSIPFYAEVQRLTAALASRYATEESAVYDLGCSTGATLVALRDALRGRKVQLIGVDSSEAMCRRAREKLGAGGGESTAPRHGDAESTAPRPRGGDGRRDEPTPPVEIRRDDITETPIRNASAVIMNYTLQFVPTLKRRPLLERIHSGLLPGGILLISDKTLQGSSDVSRLFVDIYYELKRSMGYSGLEIAQKREALENVLIP